MDNGRSVAGSVRATDNGRLSSLTMGGKNVGMIAITEAALFSRAMNKTVSQRLPAVDDRETKGL